MNGDKKSEDDATKLLVAVTIEGDSASRRDRPTVEYNAEAVAQATAADPAALTSGALPPRPLRPSGVRAASDTMTEGPSAREEVATTGLPELPADNVDLATAMPPQPPSESAPTAAVPWQKGAKPPKAEDQTVQRPSVSGKATQRSPQVARPSIRVRDDKLPTQVTKLPLHDPAAIRPERQTVAELPTVTKDRSPLGWQIALALAMVVVASTAAWFAFGRDKGAPVPPERPAIENGDVTASDPTPPLSPEALHSVEPEKPLPAVELAAASTPVPSEPAPVPAVAPEAPVANAESAKKPALAAPAMAGGGARAAVKAPRAVAQSARWSHEVAGTAGDPAAPYLALRAEPSPLADMVAQMPDGTRVEVLGEKGRWREVRIRSGKDNKLRGYCNGRWLRLRK